MSERLHTSISSTWPHKQDLNNDDTNGHNDVDEGKIVGISPRPITIGTREEVFLRVGGMSQFVVQ